MGASAFCWRAAWPAAWGEPARPGFPPEGETGKGEIRLPCCSPRSEVVCARWQTRHCFRVCPRSSSITFPSQYDHQPICRSARLALAFQKSCRRHSLLAVLLSPLFMGRRWGPVQVGVRSKAQVHHHGDGPRLLGAAISLAISEGSERYTQSPEQGGGCHCLPKLLPGRAIRSFTAARWPPSQSAPRRIIIRRNPEIQDSLQRLRAWLVKETAGQTPVDRPALLRACTKLTGLLTPAQQSATATEILARQRPDSGFSMSSARGYLETQR
jgi:hypothetical protein